MTTGTSNTTSLPTSPLSSSPSTLAELNGSGQDNSPPARPGMLRSNGASSTVPQFSRSLRFNSSEPNVSSGGKGYHRSTLGSSPGPDGRLSEESEDEEEDEEYGIDAVRSVMMAGDASTQDMDFPFSIDVPVEDESSEPSDVRGRGDSLSTNLSATTASTSSLRPPALPVILPSSEDTELSAHSHRPPPLTGLRRSNVSTHAQAEALVARARGQVLTAREGDDIPLSARLAALGESLRLERELKQAEGGATPGLVIERRASESTALDTTDAEPWEHARVPGVKMRSASASAGAGASFDKASSRRPASGLGSAGKDRNFSLEYRGANSWRGRARRPNTNDGALSSDDGKSTHFTSVLMSCTDWAVGFLLPPSSPDMHVIHHRSRSAAPGRSESDGTRILPENRTVRTPVQSPRLARAPSLDQSSFTEITVPSPGIKSAPITTASPTPLSRSRTPDPDPTRGTPLTRIATAPSQDSSLFNYVVPSPVIGVVARRGNERAQAVSRANKLAKMGFAPEVKVLSTGAATPPGHGHGHGHRFGIRSLVQSLKGKS